jgi:hypothetical protein
VSFSSPGVQKILNRDFEAAYLNIEADPNSGVSFAHDPKDPPGQCIRGNGEHNVQMLLLTPAGEIFSTLSGYIEPEGLEDELQFALDTFAELGKHKESLDREVCVETSHVKYLEKLGFRENEIQAEDLSPFFPGLAGLPANGIPFGAENLPGGLQMNNIPDKLFREFKRARILTDHRFAMRNPLLPVEEFKSERLVGSGMSFFGSARSAPGGFIGVPSQPAKPKKR